MVVEEDRLKRAAIELAEQLASLPPSALRATKALLRSVETANLDDCLKLSRELQARLQLQPDHREAIDAILEKREPAFTGRS